MGKDLTAVMSALLIKRPGGKSRLLRYILPLIPTHTCYCEPFGGGAAVLLSKPRSKTEVYNDLDEELVNLFRQAKEHPDELGREFEFAINSRQEFHRLRKQTDLTEIQRAARFLFINTLSFSGDGHSFGVQKASGGGAASSLSAKLAALKQVHARLEGVIIEHLPYERVFANYDGPSTFFFLDPPYTKSSLKMAYRAFREEEMRLLRDRLGRLKGKFLLTVDDSESNRLTFADWSQQAVEHANYFKDAKVPTLLIRNFDPEETKP